MIDWVKAEWAGWLVLASILLLFAGFGIYYYLLFGVKDDTIDNKTIKELIASNKALVKELKKGKGKPSYNTKQRNKNQHIQGKP